MFLMNLNEKSKERFLQLCVLAANANNVFEESEKQMIYEYCNEMQIEKTIPEVVESLEDLLKEIKENETVVDKRIMLIEIIGILYADADFDESEIDFLDKCVQGFDLDEKTVNEIKKLFIEYLEFYKRMAQVVLG